MKRIQKQLNAIVSIVKNHPKTSIALGSTFLLAALLRKYHHNFVVHPDIGGRHNDQNPHGDRHPKERGLSYEDITIPTENGLSLRGWYIRHPNPSQILVYFHQNAGNIGGRLFFVESYLKNTNTSILLVAYRGFSDSDGISKPTESQIMKDSVAIFSKGLQLSKKQNLPLFVFGRSLGGAAAIHVLSRPQFEHSSKGLILQNTFTSIFAVASNLVPMILIPIQILLWFVTFGSFHSVGKIKDVHVPVLFIKGKRDELVPSRLMDQLEGQLRKKKREHFSYEVPNGTHNDTWYRAGKNYFSVVNQFIEHCSRI